MTIQRLTEPVPAFIVRFLKGLIIALLPLWLVLGSVRLLVTDHYLALEYGKASFPHDHAAFDVDQHLTYASANFRFVRDRLGHEALAGQQLGGRPLYNEREIRHMHDVQAVYQAIWLIWKAAGALLLLAALVLVRRVETRPALLRAVQWGGLFTAGLVAAIGLLAVVAWQAWFIAFHEIFFAPGTWTFSYTDTLIRLFPEKFWFDAAVTISGLSLVGGLAIALAGWSLDVSLGQPSLRPMPSKS